jgi:phosphoribosyl-ATP pyrophosphohydrolase
MSQSNPGRRNDRSSRGRTDRRGSQPDLAEEAREKARRVTQRVKEEAAEVVDEASRQASSFISEQRDSIMQQLGSLGEVLRESAASLRERQATGIASLASQAADSVEQFSDGLEEQELRDMIDSVQNWARRHPAIFLGGCFIGGLLVARFFKSSADMLDDAPARRRRSRRAVGRAHRPRDVGQRTARSSVHSPEHTGGSTGTSASWEEP